MLWLLRRHVKTPRPQALLVNQHGHQFERLSIVKNLRQPGGGCLLHGLMQAICRALRPKLLERSHHHTKVLGSWKCRLVAVPNYYLHRPMQVVY